MPWEQELRSGQVERMTEAEWRYFVISFRGNNHTALEIEDAFSLLPSELQVGFTIVTSFGGHGLAWHPGRLFYLLQEARWGHLTFVEVSAADIEKIVSIHAQLQSHDHLLIDVKRLVRQLRDLDGLPTQSSSRFLGYFAILEAVLTHSPNPTDPYDSITRQIKKKLELLNHRFDPHIDYSRFGNAAADTIWGKMYSCRSSLAHGGEPDFGRELSLLGDQANALKLVKEAVKKVIRQALIEPQLLADLRDC